MTRCFVAFEFEAATLAYLEEQVRPVHRLLADGQGWPVRLIRPENWHVTVLFFDDLEEAARREVWDAVETAAQSGVWGELAFAWEGLAVWPNPRRPSLICLEAGLFPGTSAWPLPLDREPFALAKIENYLAFRPHATVMRFHRRWRKPVGREWRELAGQLPPFDPARIRFDRVSFLLSTLTPENPVYPREYTARLR